MRLNAKILKNVNHVNSWSYANQAYMQEGQANSTHIQLVDLDQSISAGAERSPANPEFPIRYISQATAITVTASFDSLVDDEKFDIVGTQPFASDKSIWKFDLTAEQVPHSGNLKITVTEDGASRSFFVKGAVTVDTLNIGSC